MRSYKSSLRAFDELVVALEKLPSIGKKSAQKMAYSLCVENKLLGLNVAHAIESAALVVQRCHKCFGLSEGELCEICLDESRHNGELCIVASPRDIFTLEEIGEYGGRYFVLDSGLDLEEIDFGLLCQRIVSEGIVEVIFALSPSLANEAVMLYVEDKILGGVTQLLQEGGMAHSGTGAFGEGLHQAGNVNGFGSGAGGLSGLGGEKSGVRRGQILNSVGDIGFSKIAQGVPTGIGLDSIDSLSLSRALSARVKL